MTIQIATEHAAQIGLILGAYGTVVGGREAVYVSAPITSGQRFAEWRSRVGNHPLDQASFGDEHRDSVIGPNVADARKVVLSVRNRFPDSVVIDPTALPDVPKWGQPEYRELWRNVIEQYVKVVVFVNGWEHSKGCCYEYFAAYVSGAMTLDSQFESLPVSRAGDLIGAAIQAHNVAGIETAFLVEIQDSLARSIRHG